LRFRAAGEITAVNPAEASFELQTLRGQSLTIVTDQDTRFRSPGGDIQAVGDLTIGMKAIAIGVISQDGQHLARQVGAAAADSIQRHVLRKAGVISSVTPGQSTFSLQPDQGDEVAFQVSDRTHFVSRDGNLSGIHDLKKGMHVRVAALVTDNGSPEAIVVAVVPDGGPGRGQQVDVRKAGKIVELGDQSLVLQTRDGTQLSVAVNGETIYRSLQGKVQGFDDLQVGMLIAVGANQAGDQLSAVWIAAGRVRPIGPPQDGAPGPAGGTGVEMPAQTGFPST
jgi:hypothetical protein